MAGTRYTVIWVFKAILLFWICNFLLLAALFLVGFNLQSRVSSGFLSKILLESGVVFLIGGGIAFSSGVFSSKVQDKVNRKEEDWSMDRLRKSEQKANKYGFLGIILFLESLIISVLSL